MLANIFICIWMSDVSVYWVHCIRKGPEKLIIVTCPPSRVATVREKYLENETFSRSGKSQGILWMVREFQKGLGKSRKKYGYGRQTSENLFFLFKRDKDVLSHEIVKAHLPPHWGLLLKERICSLGEQILSFKSNPQNLK